MLCTVKGRSEDGYPLEGIDVIPNFPPREDESNTIPKLVQLLQTPIVAKPDGKTRTSS